MVLHVLYMYYIDIYTENIFFLVETLWTPGPRRCPSAWAARQTHRLTFGRRASCVLLDISRIKICWIRKRKSWNHSQNMDHINYIQYIHTYIYTYLHIYILYVHINITSMIPTVTTSFLGPKFHLTHGSSLGASEVPFCRCPEWLWWAAPGRCPENGCGRASPGPGPVVQFTGPIRGFHGDFYGDFHGDFLKFCFKWVTPVTYAT